MFKEIPKEQFSERNKKCLIEALDKMYNFFSTEKLAYDDDFLENLKIIIEKIEKLQPEQIAADNHMKHIIGQLDSGFGYARRIKNIPEVKEESKLPDKEMRRKYRENFIQIKNSLKKYIKLCLNEAGFLNAEVSFAGGYWGDKRTDDNKLEIAEMNAHQFVDHSWKKFEEKKDGIKEAA